MVKKVVTRKSKLIDIVVDVAYKNDEEAVEIIFEAIKEQGFNPEDFLYTALGKEEKPELKKYGIRNKDNKYFFAFTYEQVKNLDSSSGNLIDIAKYYENPIIALRHADKTIKIDKILELEEIQRLFDTGMKGNPSFAYGATNSYLKDTYAGSIELTLE